MTNSTIRTGQSETTGLPLAGVILCVFNLTLAGCSSQDDGSDWKLYECFKEYRVSISRLEDHEENLRYFSESVISDWAQSLIYVERENWDRRNKLVERQYLIGHTIQKVHSVEETALLDDRFQLDIYYSNNRGNGQSRIGLIYVVEGGEYLIDGFVFYVSPFTEIPSTIVDDYSELPRPSALDANNFRIEQILVD